MPPPTRDLPVLTFAPTTGLPSILGIVQPQSNHPKTAESLTDRSPPQLNPEAELSPSKPFSQPQPIRIVMLTRKRE